jgi:predicted MFS family arabinose efflux permease
MSDSSALKTAIGLGAITISITFAAYPNEQPERPITDETQPSWNSSFKNLLSKSQIHFTVACFLGYLTSCTTSSFAQATIQEHSSLDNTDISLIISLAAITKVITKTIIMPMVFKRMKKPDYVMCTATLGMIHATLIALHPENKTSTYISFILAAIASSSNTAIISEILKNTDQQNQSRTQGLISALIALAKCIGPIILLNTIPKTISMDNHPTYIFLAGAILYAAQASTMLLQKTTNTQHNNSSHKSIEEPLTMKSISRTSKIKKCDQSTHKTLL